MKEQNDCLRDELEGVKAQLRKLADLCRAYLTARKYDEMETAHENLRLHLETIQVPKDDAPKPLKGRWDFVAEEGRKASENLARINDSKTL